MFSLVERKEHTIKITNYIKTILFKLTKNNVISGYILVLLHWIILGIPLIYLIIGEINSIYYVCCLIWSIVIVLHFYFKGCILTRIERSLWQEKKWWGPWIFFFTPLEKIGIDMTNELANNIFICWGVIILLYTFLRLLYHMK
jgi:hypothetical protein